MNWYELLVRHLFKFNKRNKQNNHNKIEEKYIKQ